LYSLPKAELAGFRAELSPEQLEAVDKALSVALGLKKS